MTSALRCSSYLFVYGTLLRGSKTLLGAAERRRLARESVVLGTATMPGELRDLGNYPGFVITKGSKKSVQGEILDLKDPQRTFRWLDKYEGVSEHAGKKGEYSRECLIAKLETGKRIRAWVYVFQAASKSDRTIPNGVWQPKKLYES